MKKLIATFAAVLLFGATAIGASALKSPSAEPVKPGDDSAVSPDTGYSVMAEVGAIAAVVSCSAAGIVLSKKIK
ncbi:MAG: hypothetical protein IJZ57_08590 [Clostridia bacterium]|nr:hypothetical protein [Clostridia bacterium]